MDDPCKLWVEFTYSKEFIRKVVQTSHGVPVGTKLALSRHQVSATDSEPATGRGPG